MVDANSINLGQTGYASYAGGGVFNGRTFQAGAGITLTNPDGIAGNTTISTSGTTDLHAPRFIVASSTLGTGANFTTINAAVASAQGTGLNSTIFIQPGTYTENIVLPAGISLCAFDCNGFSGDTIILGKISCSTSNASNQNCISGLYLQTNGDYILQVTGSNTCLVKVINCFFSCNNGSAINCQNANASIFIKECSGNVSVNDTIFVVTNTATTPLDGGLLFVDCFFDNNGAVSTTASTISAGLCQIFNSRFLTPITTSGTANFTLSNSTMDCSGINSTALTIGGSGGNTILNSNIVSGTASAISIGATSNLINCEVSSSNTNAITGAGTINFGGSYFVSTSSLINTTTQVPLVGVNSAVKVTTPGAYPYTTIPQDHLIKVDTSSARTITPLASPTTGQYHRIKDTVGSAGTNNITVTPSGKNIDGVASKIINTNYGSIDIIYNGSEWSIL